jgi:hypothetical protein
MGELEDLRKYKEKQEKMELYSFSFMAIVIMICGLFIPLSLLWQYGIRSYELLCLSALFGLYTVSNFLITYICSLELKEIKKMLKKSKPV